MASFTTSTSISRATCLAVQEFHFQEACSGGLTTKQGERGQHDDRGGRHGTKMADEELGPDLPIVSRQLSRNFDVEPNPSESRLHKLSNKYSWALKFLLEQRLGPFEVDAIRRPESESKTCIT
uniref:Uncharacterized protein n=1 Tax=Oryza sativa subsp. japonica TaxID=39947 RepID=Q2QUI3_ORYSJ|nr:hypothetical protein LOC_Os12g16170 [Oryza sativa Japonica Group]